MTYVVKVDIFLQISVLLLLSVSIIVPFLNVSGQELVTYDNPDLRMSMKVPFEWKVNEDNIENLAKYNFYELTFSSPEYSGLDSTGSAIILKVEYLPYLDLSIQRYDKEHELFDMNYVRNIKLNSSAILGDYPANSYTYQVVLDHDDVQYVKELRAIHGHYLYSLRYLGYGQVSYDKYLQIFEATANSFKLY